MPYLAIIDGLPPKFFPLREGRWLAGRSPECDFLLNQLEISRKHAAFIWDGKCCRIEDLDSSRGTWVNGQRLASAWTLAVGDEIAIGSVKLSFCAGTPPLINPQPPAESPPSTPESDTPTIIVEGKSVERFDVSGEMTIGRLQGVEIWLNHPSVSRRHASFKNQPGHGVTVTDLKSTAGSFLNGKRFDTQSLIIGDRLQIGPIFLQFDGHGFHRVENGSGESLRTQNLIVRSGSTLLLNEINLLLPASRFIGIIGPSGAGKSTLLNTLSGLRKPDHGEVLVNGEPMDFAHNPGSFGYVPQEDIVHPELTAHQALTFSAGLRLPKGTPRLEVKKLVKKTIDQLGLAPHQSKRIGQLSGGQRKRVSVAVELLAHPRILFLDEPSSGLDPATEFQLVELLRTLADTGCTVICTTHVMENAYLMDQLVVLVGGSLAFQGSAQATRNYFQVPKLSALYARLSEHPPQHWKDAFHSQNLAGAVPLSSPSPHLPSPTQPPRPSTLPILLARQWAILSSDKQNFLLLLGQPLLIATLVAWVSNDRSLSLFFAYLATLWFGCSNAAQEVVKELPIYRRERLVGVSTHTYLTSKYLFLASITTLQSLLLYLVILFASGGRDGSVSLQIIALFGTALAGVGIGLVISTLARTPMQAVILVPIVLIPQILFSGRTVPPPEMSPTVLAVSHLSPAFSAQTIIDTSFLWQKTLNGELLSEHHQSYRNLDPDRDFNTGDLFNRSRPALLALLGHALWALLAYAFAWFSLQKRRHL